MGIEDGINQYHNRPLRKPLRGAFKIIQATNEGHPKAKAFLPVAVSM